MDAFEFTREDMERFELSVREGVVNLLAEVAEVYKDDPDVRKFTPHLSTVIVISGVRENGESAILGSGSPIATMVKTVSAFDTLWVLSHGLAHVANAKVLEQEPGDIRELDRPAGD